MIIISILITIFVFLSLASYVVFKSVHYEYFLNLSVFLKEKLKTVESLNISINEVPIFPKLPSNEVTKTIGVNNKNKNDDDNDTFWSALDNVINENGIKKKEDIDEYCAFLNRVAIDDDKKMNNTKTATTTTTTTKKSKRKKSKRKKKAIVTCDGGQYEPLASHRARGNIRIARNLTDVLIPERIRENIGNPYTFIDGLTALQFNDKNGIINDGEYKILNYNFHDKETGEILYCIISKLNCLENRGYKWQMIEKLFTAKDIEKEYKIKSNELPLSSQNIDIFKCGLSSEILIKNALLNNEQFVKFIKYTSWHKLVIFKKVSNIRRLTLSLSKERFIKSLNDINIKNIKLIPIVMFNNDKHWVEYILILRINNEPCIDIGLSLRFDIENNKIICTGIHIDKQLLYQQHLLIANHLNENNECKCFDEWVSIINDLHIGNPDDMENQMKHYKAQYEQSTLLVQQLMEEKDNNISSTVKASKLNPSANEFIFNKQQQEEIKIDDSINKQNKMLKHEIKKLQQQILQQQQLIEKQQALQVQHEEIIKQERIKYAEKMNNININAINMNAINVTNGTNGGYGNNGNYQYGDQYVGDQYVGNQYNAMYYGSNQ